MKIKQVFIDILESDKISATYFKDYTVNISNLGFTKTPCMIGFHGSWFVVHPLSITKDELRVRVYNPTTLSLWGSITISLAIVY